MNSPTALVQKLWNYCAVPLPAGLHCSDYVELETLYRHTHRRPRR